VQTVGGGGLPVHRLIHAKRGSVYAKQSLSYGWGKPQPADYTPAATSVAASAAKANSLRTE